MQEKQTPPSFAPTEKPQRPDTDIDANVHVVESHPGLTSADFTQLAARRAARSIDHNTSTHERTIPGSVKVGGVLAAGAALAGAFALGNIEHGSESLPDESTFRPEIHSVTLSEGARLRTAEYTDDPSTGNITWLYDNPGEVTVSTPDGAYQVSNDNGIWYGISQKDLAASIPDAASFHDKDGIIWVNEARASAQKADISAEQ